MHMQSHIHGLELGQAGKHRCANAHKLGVALQSAAHAHSSTTEMTQGGCMRKHTSVVHGLNVNKTVKCTSIQAGQRVVTEIKVGQGSKTVEGARLDRGDGVVVEISASDLK